ncbi:MAG: type II toxin-antitoxin system RelE/ParE family toxin [Sulfuricellaceae bacterium]|nr:type II toxin-antitoxin system RelE/ParE family toxin [Sulfuricellaceae bacterium]
MTSALEWSENARADLLAIIDHISDDSPQAAQDLKNEIESKANILPANPRMYAKSKRAPGYRQLTVRDNYLVFYRLLPTEKDPLVIDVAAVVHSRRNWPPPSAT